MPRRAGDGKQSSINHGAAVIALETPRHSKAGDVCGCRHNLKFVLCR